jgi:hypothetical protein
MSDHVSKKSRAMQNISGIERGIADRPSGPKMEAGARKWLLRTGRATATYGADRLAILGVSSPVVTAFAIYVPEGTPGVRRGPASSSQAPRSASVCGPGRGFGPANAPRTRPHRSFGASASRGRERPPLNAASHPRTDGRTAATGRGNRCGQPPGGRFRALWLAPRVLPPPSAGNTLNTVAQLQAPWLNTAIP